jgi:hypothetical protein
MGAISGLLRRHPRRAAVATAAALAAIAAGAFVLVWFQPQKLVIDETVREAAPTVARTTPRTPAATTFRGIDHHTTGKVLVLGPAGTGSTGVQVLRFEDLDTSNGPDLRVYLSTTPPDGDRRAFDDDYVELGRLKGNVGDQNYDIPPGTDLERFESVVIWCKRFGVPFGAAPLP